MNKIGFMQGRLCEQVNGHIQAFPWQDWQKEFPIAASIGLGLLEWTLDDKDLHKNPLMHEDGRKIINDLCVKYQIAIPSVTGDCFMQRPFWKEAGTSRRDLQDDFLKVTNASARAGIKFVVVPLVDNGRIETKEQENIILDFFLENHHLFVKQNIAIAFESDYEPSFLERFISQLPNQQFGINYDIGNSAASGFNAVEEIHAYGSRILNVHIKDRIANGPTIKLGRGAANFENVFSQLKKCNYEGNFILQTARAESGKHTEVLLIYKDFTLQLIRENGFL